MLRIHLVRQWFELSDMGMEDALLETALVCDVGKGAADEQPSDSAIANLARAFYWQRLLDEGHVSSGAEIAEREGLHVSTVNEMLRLALMDPDGVMAANHTKGKH